MDDCSPLWNIVLCLRAAALPPDDEGDSVQMKLSYSTFAPFLLYLIDWMDYSCTDTIPSYLGLLHILVYKVKSRFFQKDDPDFELYLT